jgi:CBS domain-containing protein
MKTCADVMTKDPVSCLPEEKISDVALLMKAQDIGPVLIVDSEEDQRLVGIITDRDIAIKVVADGLDPQSTPVSQVMTRDPVTCLDTDELGKALSSMSSYQLRRIPVVNESGRLVGIIAQADIATRLNEPDKTAEVVKDISQ